MFSLISYFLFVFLRHNDIHPSDATRRILTVLLVLFSLSVIFFVPIVLIRHTLVTPISGDGGAENRSDHHYQQHQPADHISVSVGSRINDSIE